jgi:hypothetical protein
MEGGVTARGYSDTRAQTRVVGRHQAPHIQLGTPAGYPSGGFPPAAENSLHLLTDWGNVRVSGRANTPSWVYRRRLTGRLWNTASCLTAAPLIIMTDWGDWPQAALVSLLVVNMLLCVVPFVSPFACAAGLVCVNPTQECVNPTQECVNPTQECVNLTQECVNPNQECVNPNQECVNPPRSV